MVATSRRPAAPEDPRPLVLLIDDEPAIVSLVQVWFEHLGLDLIAAGDCSAGERLLVTRSPDLLLLDWMLPGVSGLQFVKRLRSMPDTEQLPIILLSARAAEEDVVLALDSGADDFVRKPFSPRILDARIRALLRRRQPFVAAAEIGVERGPLSVDVGAQRLLVRGEAVLASRSELLVLRRLMRAPGRVLTRSQLAEALGQSLSPIQSRAIDAHVRRLRSLLAGFDLSHLLETVRGIGYRFNEDALERVVIADQRSSETAPSSSTPET